MALHTTSLHCFILIYFNAVIAVDLLMVIIIRTGWPEYGVVTTDQSCYSKSMHHVSKKDDVLDIPAGFREEDEIAVLKESEDIAKLRTILDDDEVVFRLILCVHNDGEAVLVATNKRIVFCDKKFLNTTILIMKYGSIAAIMFQNEGIFTRITLASIDRSIMVRGVDRVHGNRFIRFIGDKIGNDYKVLEEGLKAYEYNNQDIILE